MDFLPPLLESLEPRQMCAILLGPGRILHVQGSPTQPNTITIGLSGSGSSVSAEVSFPTRKGIRTQSAIYPLNKIRLLVVNGGNADDQITIDQANGSFPIKTVILTHNGNDTVLAGDEADKIVLGGGKDVVSSGGGNDTIFAGRGHDTLSGGAGNDVFHGGPGHDDIVAGAGNNILVDPYGHDTLLAGSGHDVFVVKNIHLDPNNNYDPRKDRLRRYTPPSANNSQSIASMVLNGLFDSFFF